MQLVETGPAFLGAARGLETSQVAIIGAPLDQTESFKAGTAQAPARIRAVSDVLETFSPILNRDLLDIRLADWGDVQCAGLSMTNALDAIENSISAAAERSFPLMLGGEHTATLAAIRALQKIHPQLYVLQCDAHLDLRDEYDGKSLSHATVLRRVTELIGMDHLLQLGVRSGTREEFALAHHCLASRRSLGLSAEEHASLADAPIYLTIDIDVLDPSTAPGTGCPEPGGPLFGELQDFVHSLGGLNVVGADVMEVLPSADMNDVTSVAAAKIVREIALLFARDLD